MVEDISTFGCTHFIYKLAQSGSAFNLINGVNIAETEARILQYRQENAALIELNIQRDERDVTSLQEQEDRERREREERAAELKALEEEERLEKEREKLAIIDSLVSLQDTSVNHFCLISSLSLSLSPSKTPTKTWTSTRSSRRPERKPQNGRPRWKHYVKLKWSPASVAHEVAWRAVL